MKRERERAPRVQGRARATGTGLCAAFGGGAESERKGLVSGVVTAKSGNLAEGQGNPGEFSKFCEILPTLCFPPRHVYLSVTKK